MSEISITHRLYIDPMSPYLPGRPIEEVKKEFGLERVIKLASNENPLGCSPKVIEAVAAEMKNCSLYPDGSCAQLRKILADSLMIKPSELVFGCGADEIIAMAGKVFINTGDECITGEVTFSQYEASVVSMGGKMIFAPLKNGVYDLDAILERITNKTKIIFIANPNNPTGSSFGHEVQEKFLSQVPKNILVVLDEAYAEYTTDINFPKTLSMMKKYSNIMLIKTFSKIYGLASLRVGYGIANENLISLFEKVRPPFNVNSQAQAAASAAYFDKEFVNKSIINNNKSMAIAIDEINNLGLSFVSSQANFIWFDCGKNSRDIFLLLMKRGYIIRPGSALAPGIYDNYIRVTLGLPEQIQGFFNELKEIL